jgi:uncharacterized protein (UPF0333 family)
MKGSRKGQVSTELLFVIAAILVLFIPLLVLTYFKANEANEQVMQLQSQVVAIRLSELANSIGSASGSSSVKAEVFIPSTVSQMIIVQSKNSKNEVTGGEIILKTTTQTGTNDIVGIIRSPVKAYAGNDAFSFSNAGLVRFEITKETDANGFEQLVFKKLD